MKIRIATRGSKLSLIQTKMLIDRVKRVYPDIDVETIIVKTAGDSYQEIPLQSIGVKGIFEKEVNRAVIANIADVAVHSLKDVPAHLDQNLKLACVLPRDSPYDVLVSRYGLCLEDLPPGCKVGTSSARRKAMVLNVRPDLTVEPIRGNVDTRIRKLRSGVYDAIILAEAGILRLKEDISYFRLKAETFTPAPCQGIIGAYVREDDEELANLLTEVSCVDTMYEALAEREVLAKLPSGCHAPLGCLARVKGDMLSINVTLLTPDGKDRCTVTKEGPKFYYKTVAKEAAKDLMEMGKSIVAKLEGMG